VLVDDVLHTGRTIRAAMDALMAYGRPSRIELLTLIDRKFSRELPVQSDYTGRSIDTIMSQKVIVEWEPEPRILLID
jgi:pyrimidine operon attenuation protein/uracil phosphoribosyltransferase